jgi:hypothetical protein
MPRLLTGYIDEDDCIGDSLGPTGGGNKGTINANYLALDEAVQSLSAYDNSLRPALTPIGSNLTITNNLTANNITTTGNIITNNNITALNEVRTNTIRSTAGAAHFVNGYPRQPGQIIEYLSSPCDGSIVTVGSGTYQFQNVTTWPGVFYTYQDLTGSVMVYTPPPGATRVIYRFEFGMWWGGPGHSINHFKFFIEGTEVFYARHNRSGQLAEYKAAFEWPIAIGGTPNTNTGRLASWTSPLTLKMQWRAYGTSNYGQPHVTNYWDGVGANFLIMPVLTIMAIA